MTSKVEYRPNAEQRKTMLFTRRALLCMSAALPAAGCVNRLAPPHREELRILTFNIWHDRKWEQRRPLLIQALREADADLIALQEVLQDASKGLPNQAETLAEALGGYSVHFTSVDPAGAQRRYGNAILSRLPVLESDSKKLEPLKDYRTALRVRVLAAGRPIDVVVTHLAYQADAGAVRARQLADLMSWLPNENVPLVLLGDFNAELSEASLTALTSARFEVAPLPSSVSTTLNVAEGHNPLIIDHILAERQWFEVSPARLIGFEATNGIHTSDHFGVAATLRLR